MFTPLLFRRFAAMSMRMQILWLAFILSAPAFLLTFNHALRQRDALLKDGVRNGLFLIENIASVQKNISGNAEELLTVLAQLPQIRTKDAAATSKILSDILALNKEYGNIILTDRSGEIWASALPSTKTASIAGVRSFQNALKTGRFSSGEYNVGKISRKRTLGFCYPILNAHGEMENVASVNLNFDMIRDAATAGLSSGSLFTITDHRGTILSSNLESESRIGKMEDAELFQHMKNGPESESFIGTGRKGAKQIISYHSLKLSNEATPYLYLIIATPLGETLRQANMSLLKNSSLLLPFLILVILFVLKICDYSFVKPIDSLQAAYIRLARGDLDVRVSEFVEGGELARLGHAFDDMAQRLADRTSELNRSESKFRFFAENSAEIIWQLNADRRIIYINPSDERLRGFTRDEVLGKSVTELMPSSDAELLDDLNSKRISDEERGVLTGLIRYDASMKCKSGKLINVEIFSLPIRDEHGHISGYYGVARDITERKKFENEREKLIAELQHALAEIRTLSGILPICSYCKKIRNDEGYWNQLESYISTHTEARFSHGICPDCAIKAYEEIDRFS